MAFISSNNILGDIELKDGLDDQGKWAKSALGFCIRCLGWGGELGERRNHGHFWWQRWHLSCVRCWCRLFLFIYSRFVNGGKQHLMPTGIERTGKGTMESIMDGDRAQRGLTTVDSRPRENEADKRRLYPSLLLGLRLIASHGVYRNALGFLPITRPSGPLWNLDERTGSSKGTFELSD